MGMTEPLLTPAQVAEACAVTAGTVRRWLDEGLLPFVRIPSGVRRVRSSDLDALINGVSALAGGPE